MRTLTLAAVAALSLLSALPAAGQDLTGTWEIAYTMETPRGAMERTLTLNLAQDGTALTGTAEMAAMARGGQGGGTRTVDISDGKVEGASFSFSVVMGGGQRTFTLTFNGSVDGDAMKGTLATPMGGETAFAGKRAG